MLIGIDVGGTCTDGVAFQDGTVIRWDKRPTNSERLRESIEAVLDNLLQGETGPGVERIVLSTTLVTNLLATGRLEKAALLVIPGPGLNPYELQLTDEYFVLRGGVDFCGREIEALDPEEVRSAGQLISSRGIKKAAVVGKFCQRNPAQEIMVRSLLKQDFPDLDILMGHQVSAELNFPRRAVTAFYTLTTRDYWNQFADEIEEALRARQITVPIEVMKADGGTMSLKTSRDNPCQMVFSGPAASTMGAFALTMDGLTSVVVDIGGTTTDLAFILEGKPLHASKGARIGDRHTHIKALALRSAPLGGDSEVRIDESGRLMIGPDRRGNAACFGGPAPTPTDAFNILGEGGLGDVDLSYQALAGLCGGDRGKAKDLAARVIQQFIGLLQENIQEMMRSWEQEPAYRVWEIVNRRRVKLERVIGIGAASPAVIPLLAESLHCQGLVNPLSPVGNALGAVVARPTLQLTLHADTQAGSYNIGGVVKKMSNPGLFQLRDARELAEKELLALAEERGMAAYFEEREFVWEEQFNVVRDWSTTGRIYDVGISISPGVVEGFRGVKS